MMSPRKRSEETTRQLRVHLLDHARRLVIRDGASALTMRALAAEAGVSVGLPYKVFADRREIVAEIVHGEVATLRAAADELNARAGTGKVGGNLIWFAKVVLDSPAVPLAQELLADQALTESVTAAADRTGVGPGDLPHVFGSYLVAEHDAGRVAGDVDTDAFGFLIAGALHNLVIAGQAWPRPDRPHLERYLTAVATAIAADPTSTAGDHNDTHQ
ncbi:MAG TPA: TetR/AcrR family transcriptional regulator [Jiangellaceae bacterium]|nr:TetR/AcrR family transcriptional regulator [Jiangellaceae bacterium]